MARLPEEWRPFGGGSGFRVEIYFTGTYIRNIANGAFSRERICLGRQKCEVAEERRAFICVPRTYAGYCGYCGCRPLPIEHAETITGRRRRQRRKTIFARFRLSYDIYIARTRIACTAIAIGFRKNVSEIFGSQILMTTELRIRTAGHRSTVETV